MRRLLLLMALFGDLRARSADRISPRAGACLSCHLLEARTIGLMSAAGPPPVPLVAHHCRHRHAIGQASGSSGDDLGTSFQAEHGQAVQQFHVPLLTLVMDLGCAVQAEKSPDLAIRGHQ